MEQPPPFWAAKALADYVRGQASWRRTKAAQFPDAPRNASSANALERLALFIDDLQPTDRDLVELIELGAFNDRDEFIAGEEARRAIAGWGFDHDDPNLRRFRDLINELVAITRRERQAKTPAQERKTAMTLTQTKPTVDADVQKNLEDLFMHAIGCSRKVNALDDDFCAQLFDSGRSHPTSVTLDQKTLSDLHDKLYDWTGKIRDLLAVIAPAAVERARAISALLPNATASLFNLSPQEVDRVMCPIFEASGLADDFMPADERFPDRDDDGEAAGIGPDAAAIGVALSATRNPE